MDEEDYEEDEEEHQTWVEALTQELADDDAPEEDPDYEVGGCWVLRTGSHTLDVTVVPPVHLRVEKYSNLQDKLAVLFYVTFSLTTEIAATTNGKRNVYCLPPPPRWFRTSPLVSVMPAFSFCKHWSCMESKCVYSGGEGL